MITGRYHDDPAFAAMTLDILSNVFNQAGNPGAVSEYLTGEIRELTGARCVLFVQFPESGAKVAQRVVSVNPERKREWAESLATHRFIEAAHDQPTSKIWRAEEESEAGLFLRSENFQLSVCVPLRVGDFKVGGLFLFGLPDEDHLAAEMDLLNTLSTLVALVVRNALLYERQEQVIRERTAELQCVNHHLEVSLAERIKAQEKLIEAGQFNQQVIDSAQEGIIVYDCDLRYRVWNPYMEQISGSLAAEVIGRHPLEVFPFLKGTGIIERLKKALAGEVVDPIDFPFHLPAKGRSGWTSDTSGPLRNSKGEIVGVIGFVRDITERRKAEQVLEESEQRFRQVVENVSEVFWIVSPDWQKIHYISPAYEQVWGRSCQSLVERPVSWVESLVEEDRPQVLREIEEKVRSGVHKKEFQDYRITRPDGSIRWISARAFPVRDNQGVVTQVVGIAEDITERKSMEEKLRQSQKMESFGMLAGGVAHDFNNILAAIFMNAELLLTQPELDADSRDWTNQINIAARRAADLTRQLLTFSRKQPIRRQLLDLNEVVGNLVKMLRRIIGEDVALQCNFAPESLLVFADAGMLEQVLMNLAVNARDAMPKGGELVITLAMMSARTVTRPPSAPAEAESYVCLSVQDSGTGIAPEHLPRIFEPFFTTKEVGKGTGLGLATVYGIVEQHNGWLEVDSILEQGTTFRIYLPISREPKAETASTVSLTEMPTGTETVLVVEDESAVRSVICNCLRRLGYQIIEAHNGQEALQLWPQDRDKIDLLLTDMIMPGGLNGKDLAECLRQENEHLKIIYISGYSVDVAQDLELKENKNYLAKPFTPAALADIVRRCLDSR